jgi:hypothetical protein
MTIYVDWDDQLVYTVIVRTEEIWTWDDVYAITQHIIELSKDAGRPLACIAFPPASFVLPQTSMFENARRIVNELQSPQYFELNVYVLRDASLVALVQAVSDRLGLPRRGLYFARTLDEARGFVRQHREDA